MTELTLAEHRKYDDTYVLRIETPEDVDLAELPLETDEEGRALFRWAAEIPTVIDPEKPDAKPKPAMTQAEYEAMQQREAALLVNSAVERAVKAPGKKVKGEGAKLEAK